jgi:transposase
MKKERRVVIRYSSRYEKEIPTDLSDDEWNYIDPHMPPALGRGQPGIRSLREILNAIFFYVLRSGCQWRLLSHGFPRWPTAYHYVRKWRIDDTWETINGSLFENACGFACEGTLSPVRASWIASL